MLNRNNIIECNLLEIRIKEVMKITNKESAKEITALINYYFDTSYIEEDVNFIMGTIYEKEFYYKTQMEA